MPKLPPLKNRERLVRALTSLGYEVSKKYGKGGHYKLKMNGNSITIPKHLENINTRSLFEKSFTKFGGDIDALIEKI